MTKTRVLIVDGSLGGSAGNTAELLALAQRRFEREAAVEYLELVRQPSLERILGAVGGADAILFGTGTYWDSWGSPLQRFFEMTAHTEGEALWVGKPAGAVVTGHAVGSKGVLSRLFGVLNVYGMMIPPFAGFAYRWVDAVAAPQAGEHLRNELWSPADVEVVCHNLLAALSCRVEWKGWPTNQGRSGDKWLFAYSDLKPEDE